MDGRTKVKAAINIMFKAKFYLFIVVCRQWMYLEPIFTSEDISKQLPIEAKKYMTMERTWRRIMRNALENPRVPRKD